MPKRGLLSRLRVVPSLAESGKSSSIVVLLFIYPESVNSIDFLADPWIVKVLYSFQPYRHQSSSLFRGLALEPP